jgi:hypothetical protein
MHLLVLCFHARGAGAWTRGVYGGQSDSGINPPTLSWPPAAARISAGGGGCEISLVGAGAAFAAVATDRMNRTPVDFIMSASLSRHMARGGGVRPHHG